jgi:hypothetical protein
MLNVGKLVLLIFLDYQKSSWNFSFALVTVFLVEQLASLKATCLIESNLPH